MNILLWIKRIIRFPLIISIGFCAWLIMGLSALSVNIGWRIDEVRDWLKKR